MSSEHAEKSLQRGMILFEQGRFKEAGETFRGALASEPDDVEILFRLAVCEYRLDHEKQALEILDRAIALSPESAQLFAFRAFILAALNRSKDAIKAAAEAIRLEPNDPEPHAAMANSYLSMQEWKKAEACARQALELDPDHESAASMLAIALRFQNRLGESADQIAHMLRENPENSDNHTNAGWVALQGGNQQQAEQHFLEALRLDPESPHAKEGLKQAFKARSPFYRAYLNYCFFMQRFTEGKQWMLIIGFLVIARVIDKLLPSPWPLVVMVLYFLFVLWVHVAAPVGNLQLFFDRKARHSLDGAEKWEAWAVGGSVILGLLLLAGGLGLGLWSGFILGLGLIGVAFPLRYVFTNPSKLGRVVFSGVAIFVAMVVAINILPGLLPETLHGLPAQLSSAAILAVVLTTWLCNLPALRRA